MLIEIMLQIWENYVEGQEVTNGSAAESKQKETLKVLKMYFCYRNSFCCTSKMDNESDS